MPGRDACELGNVEGLAGKTAGRMCRGINSREASMRIKFSFILVLFLVTVLPAAGQTVAYSLNDTSLFTVRMPDGWRFESRPNPRNTATKRISGTASNGLVWFGVWVVKDVKTVDEAYKYVQTTARALITDAKE